MANEVKAWTTYRRVDGGDIDGHTWVDGLDWFDDLDEPVQITQQTWMLCAETTVWVGPGPYCPECGAELPKEALDNAELTFCSPECYGNHVAGVKADLNYEESKGP